MDHEEFTENRREGDDIRVVGNLYNLGMTSSPRTYQFIARMRYQTIDVPGPCGNYTLQTLIEQFNLPEAATTQDDNLLVLRLHRNKYIY
jgi:hypothetical protein